MWIDVKVWTDWVGLLERTERVLRQPSESSTLAAPPRSRQVQRRLTDAQRVALVQRYQAGAEMKELAAEFGVHRHTVSECLRQMGVGIRVYGLRGNDVAEAATLYEQGWSLAQLGRKFACTHGDVRRKLLAHGVTMRPRPGWSYEDRPSSPIQASEG